MFNSLLSTTYRSHSIDYVRMKNHLSNIFIKYLRKIYRIIMFIRIYFFIQYIFLFLYKIFLN